MRTIQQKFTRLVSSMPLIAAMAAITHCGPSRESHSTLKDQGESRDQLLAIVMSGNKSCHRHNNNPSSPVRASIFPDFNRFKDKMERTENLEIDYVLTCYDGLGRLYMTNSTNPENVLSADEDGVLPFIEEFRRVRPNHRLLLIGHSYGGWLSLKTTLHLHSELESLPRLTLVTIDPISKVNCSPFKPFGCSSSPTDISGDEYQAISGSSNPWLNFYQRQTPIVRGSAIEKASHNIEVSATHMDIDNQPLVWESIEKAILGRF